MQTPNPSITTVVMPFSEGVIEEAAARIDDGECVAMATETVYGLAADATDGEAVARIYAAKGRPAFNPLIVHVSDLDAARAIAEFNGAAEQLAARFWPGPLTLVLPLRNDSPIADIVTAGLDTIAIRVPAHPAMQALLKACDCPLAAPSANRSGQISPTTAAHVFHGLGGLIGLIVDAGPSGLGLESTIVAARDSSVQILRPGPITADQIAETSGLAIVPHETDAISAPGQLAQHYAPSKPVRLGATDAAHDEWFIGFGSVSGNATLSESGDLIEAAANLFSRLHEADASDRPKIAVAPIPETGIGEAISDRLARAAHRD